MHDARTVKVRGELGMVGDVVSVEGSRAKDGSFVGNARAVTLKSTGKRLFAASSQGETP